jgi:hypothetical protein
MNLNYEQKWNISYEQKLTKVMDNEKLWTKMKHKTSMQIKVQKHTNENIRLVSQNHDFKRKLTGMNDITT